MMRAYFDVAELDRAPDRARERIAGKLLLLDESFGEDLPLIFEFLGVPDPERPPPSMDPEARQRQLLDVIKRLVRAQSAREPGVTVFEDLHWLDPASEVFLANHVEASQGTRRPHDPQLPARVPARRGCRSPTTASSPWRRSGPRRSRRCSATCSAPIPRSTGCPS